MVLVRFVVPAPVNGLFDFLVLTSFGGILSGVFAGAGYFLARAVWEIWSESRK
jgi:hypothetical protein